VIASGPRARKAARRPALAGFGHGAREILDGVGDAIGEPGLFHLGIGGDPDHAAGPGRGAADERRLLDHKHAQPFDGGNGCRRHAAGPGADNHDVVVLMCRHHAAIIPQPSMTPSYPARADARYCLRMILPENHGTRFRIMR